MKFENKEVNEKDDREGWELRESWEWENWEWDSQKRAWIKPRKSCERIERDPRETWERPERDKGETWERP